MTIAFTNSSPIEHNVTIAQGSTVLGATPTFSGGSKTLTLQPEAGHVHVLLLGAGTPPGRHGRHAEGLVKLYVCWGTFPTPRPGGHPCANAYHALTRRRPRAGGDQVLRVRAAARRVQPDARAPRGPGADRQPLGADARARRRHRDRRLAARSSTGLARTRRSSGGACRDRFRDALDAQFVIARSPCAAARPRAIASVAANPTPHEHQRDDEDHRNRPITPRLHSGPSHSARTGVRADARINSL